MSDPGREPRGKICRDVMRLTSFTEDIVAAGKRPGSRTVACQLTTAARPCALLGAAEVIALLRVRSADDAPICIEHTYLQRKWWQLVTEADLSTHSLYALLEGHGESIFRSDELLLARSATAAEQALLGLTHAEPVVEIARTAYAENGEVVEHTENVLLASHYVFRLALHRR